MRPPADEAARALVAERYPDAVQAWLDRSGMRLTEALDLGLRRALAGERASLTTIADEVLARYGGRLWSGLHLRAELP